MAAKSEMQKVALETDPRLQRCTGNSRSKVSC